MSPRPEAFARATNPGSTYLKQCSAMAGKFERKTSTAAPAGEVAIERTQPPRSGGGDVADAGARAARRFRDDSAGRQQIGQEALASHRLEDAVAARKEHERERRVHAASAEHAGHRRHV